MGGLALHQRLAGSLQRLSLLARCSLHGLGVEVQVAVGEVIPQISRTDFGVGRQHRRDSPVRPAFGEVPFEDHKASRRTIALSVVTTAALAEHLRLYRADATEPGPWSSLMSRASP